MKNVDKFGVPEDHTVPVIVSLLTTKSSGSKRLNAMFDYVYAVLLIVIGIVTRAPLSKPTTVNVPAN